MRAWLVGFMVGPGDVHKKKKLWNSSYFPELDQGAEGS